MSAKYVLNGHIAIPCNDLMEWPQDVESNNRIVANTKIGDVTVSTVFLGVNHRFGPGLPLLFETMIFGGAHDQFQERYSTWEEAESGHARALKLVQS